MKSLNDSLREEFADIIKENDIQELIEMRKLDQGLIAKAFEKLLQNKYGQDEDSVVDKGRAEFETYIINALKTKAH